MFFLFCRRAVIFYADRCRFQSFYVGGDMLAGGQRMIKMFQADSMPVIILLYNDILFMTNILL